MNRIILVSALICAVSAQLPTEAILKARAAQLQESVGHLNDTEFEDVKVRVLRAIYSTQENEASYIPEVPFYCNEVCPDGWEFIPGLTHCYKFVDTGKQGVQMSEADAVCHEQGGHLPEFETKAQTEILRKFFLNGTSDAAASAFLNSNSTRNSKKGFWLGYARQCIEDLPWMSQFFTNPYRYGNMSEGQRQERRTDVLGRFNGNNFFSVNSVHGIMPPDLWRVINKNKAEPRDEGARLKKNQMKEEACVARKQIQEDFVTKQNSVPGGVDDYPCTSKQFVICMQNNIVALQQRCAGPNANSYLQGIPFPTVELPLSDNDFAPLQSCRDVNQDRQN